MASASKLLPPRIAELECHRILHPWTRSCVRAYLRMYLFSCFGSAGYFAILYLFQYLVRVLKNKKQYVLRDLITTYVKSCVFFSSIVASCYIGFSCFLRHVLGKFYYYSIVFVPATLAGFALLNETPRNKDFFSTAFSNMALESWIRRSEDAGRIRWTRNGQTLAFMVLASSVSYLYNEVSNDSRYFWFFVPPKMDPTTDKDGRCFHNSTCRRSLISCFFKYFSTGFFLKLLKLLFSNFRQPTSILRSLLKPKTYSFAVFLGLYAFIYQGTRCLFYRRRKKHFPLHDLVSGFLSGVTYKFDPNISVFNSAAITALQMLLEMGCRKGMLPRVPYNVLSFALSCGFLFHARFYTPKHCPPLMHYIMSSITSKGSDYIANNYHELMEKV